MPVEPDGRTQPALATLLALRHLVQTLTRLRAPPSRIRTFCRFASNRLRVATIEWLLELPKEGPFPQM